MNTKLIAVALALIFAAAAAVTALQLSQRADDDKAGDSAGEKADAPVKKLPAAKGKPVLRVSGVASGNAGARKTTVDFATLDRVARERVTLREPFLKRDQTFTGVAMKELLPALGVPASATKIYMHAQDDYHVNLPLGDVRADGFLATRVGGRPISVAKGGPIRLVFKGNGTMASNTDNWIWSIDQMRVSR